tara:strand:- start:876 stop:1382 length:507 start_codon:yes stop_codon:yes gene_type:complete
LSEAGGPGKIPQGGPYVPLTGPVSGAVPPDAGRIEVGAVAGEIQALSVEVGERCPRQVEGRRSGFPFGRQREVERLFGRAVRGDPAVGFQAEIPLEPFDGVADRRRIAKPGLPRRPQVVELAEGGSQFADIGGTGIAMADGGADSERAGMMAGTVHARSFQWKNVRGY